MNRAQDNAREENSLAREIFGLCLLLGALLLLLSLITYHPDDPSLNRSYSGDRAVVNGAGLVGSYLGGSLVEFFGVGAFAWPVLLIVAGLKQYIRPLTIPWWRWLGFILFCLCFISWAVSLWADYHLSIGRVAGGGFLGKVLYYEGRKVVPGWLAVLLWVLALVASLKLLFGLSLKPVIARCRNLADLGCLFGDFWRRHVKFTATEAEPGPLRTNTYVDREPTPDPEEFSRFEERHGGQARESTEAPPIEAIDEPLEPVVPASTEEELAQAQGSSRPRPRRPGKFLRRGKSVPPGLELLTDPPPQTGGLSRKELEDQAERLRDCLATFQVQGEVQRISPGPVVTMFEFKPAQGVRINRIANLGDDLALALKALSVRIEAPIPGKDTVGVEIPNVQRQTVFMRNIVDSQQFKSSKSFLTMVVGEDIAGRPVVADLAKMPHLLVAGATGAGKSVCLNAILLSFLFKARPEDVKLLLVDPKRIELSVYKDLPHLVHPVVTDMSQAKNALDWAVWEMDKRYEAMARLGVRNIEGYNEKLKAIRASENPDDQRKAETVVDLEAMPYLVLIIDELADLMLTAAKEVEMSIVRLAQLARAAGIHMILATQRPSVDVVTGLIKANFPCRIAFQVTSRHDSRTILDTVGAEHLLGKGDMLFKPSGGKMRRLHGAFVPDEDVAAVVGHWKRQQKPDYSLDFEAWQKEQAEERAIGGGGELAGDTMYAEAVAFVQEQGKASISLVQRRFRVGYNKAARYIEQMEIDGIIGPSEGSKPRAVLKGPE